MARPITNPETRFWTKVERGSECWLWCGYQDRNGYGLFMLAPKPLKMVFAHRMSWTFANGQIPEGKRVLHRCDNPPCVNPAHLWLGTQADNVRDMDAKGRRGVGAPRGEDSHLAKLSRNSVERMRHLRELGLTYTEIGRVFNVHKSTAARAVQSLTWK